ncbi:extracellular solute-binding protein [Leekyejoonella antrihumi]|uniref:Extracellular solute-binding protein n=1 Tax=Leekyejoonella antrihumi TaxID=1660198 RepID=A0A563DVA8_9MICO|nr:extracellular solute-binding protein [Leekyejoonella antrihumi]TWP34126.1 extracellular solute-binding protein [Leekyejoonella antrihumi]
MGQHKAGLILMGSWLPSEASAFAAKGMVYDSFPFPTVGGSGNDAARVDFSGFEIPKQAKNAKVAEQFAAFFLSKKYQTMWAKDAQLIPVRSDVPVGGSLANVVKDLTTATTFRSQDGGILYPGYTTKVLDPIDDQLFFGKITPQQFVTQMVAAQKNYWASQG